MGRWGGQSPKSFLLSCLFLALKSLLFQQIFTFYISFICRGLVGGVTDLGFFPLKIPKFSSLEIN